MSAERVARLKESLDDPNLVSFEPWVVRELLDHIDGLKFANGVLDSAAKDAQTWSYEAQTAKEAYCELLEANRVTEEAGGVIAQLNGMIDELRAQLEAQRGGAVVVPELKDSDPEWQDVAFREDGHRNAPIAKAFADGYTLAVSRIQPIPASQVLQPGMVGVDAGVLELLGIFFDQRLSVEWEPKKVELDDLDRWAKESRKAVAEYRAQQAKGE